MVSQLGSSSFDCKQEVRYLMLAIHDHVDLLLIHVIVFNYDLQSVLLLSSPPHLTTPSHPQHCSSYHMKGILSDILWQK